MTAELIEIQPPPGGWTTDDLDAMPESHTRYELIDGALIVSPSPTPLHQSIAGRLMVALESGCPDEFAVTQGVEVRISNRRSLVPDVVVVTADAVRRNLPRFAPDEVVLTVEIGSPGSVTMDRFAKPALYAAAGIPCYWRVETGDGIVVHAFGLDRQAGAYLPSGSYAETITAAEPWTMRIPIMHLTPRHDHRGA